MNNEEAIQECVKIQAFGVSERQVEAMEMAIKALKQEPCGNAIDRAEAIRIASGYCHPANVANELAKLPPVNPQPCEDAISRQAVLDLINADWKYEGLETHVASLPPVTPQQSCEAIAKAFQLGMALGFAKKHDEMDKVMEEVKKAVTPQPKTGHWIEPQQDDGMSDPIYYQVRCSECGFDLDPQTWHMELHQYGADKFCPNCGAKMQES